MNLSEAILSIPALMIAVILHEVAHGWVAYRMGDPTAKLAGRLTLNPIPHIDPVGTLILPAMFIVLNSPVIFGWAKPVPINPLNFRDLRIGTFLTSIAGVVMNLTLAVGFGITYRVLSGLSESVDPFVANSVIYPMLIFSAKSVLINLILALFNIIPIPPLDGSKALMSFLSFKYWEVFYKYEVYGFLVITLLLFTGVLGKLIYPPLVFLYHLILGGV
ncbi:Zn-dependent protease [Hydrogenivirga caldilitoris]|uniref:Zn-dependent protease n=1 Tax=Hydrogenivirga caldilitoris TaxID=246264 RepID=A0A497XQR3_9AQUI|nr:site-2 protease family protein [Hydrogenivirga caldilitoris]RLJ70621.1 Zn-dependent protease [Hydrogenivirga caldilitoris]